MMIFLITTGATGIIFCITGFTLFKFPPKKINSIIGYRTKASRANQKNWDYAQIKAGRELQWLGFTLIILGICAIPLTLTDIIELVLSLCLILAATTLHIFRVERGIKRMNSLS